MGSTQECYFYFEQILEATPPQNSSGMTTYLSSQKGARGVMVIVTGYGYGDTSSIPGQD